MFFYTIFYTSFPVSNAHEPFSIQRLNSFVSLFWASGLYYIMCAIFSIVSVDEPTGTHSSLKKKHNSNVL